MANRRSDVRQDECGAYFYQYVSLVNDIELVPALEQGRDETAKFFGAIPEDRHEYSYAPGKWTPKDMLLHIIDTERIFAYRALRFTREQDTDLPGFEQDIFAASGNANSRTMNDLLDEYTAVRNSNIAMFRSFDDAALVRIGKASNTNMSPRAVGFIICGHEIHHMAVLRDRYL